MLIPEGVIDTIWFECLVLIHSDILCGTVCTMYTFHGSFRLSQALGWGLYSALNLLGQLCPLSSGERDRECFNTNHCFYLKGWWIQCDLSVLDCCCCFKSQWHSVWYGLYNVLIWGWYSPFNITRCFWNCHITKISRFLVPRTQLHPSYNRSYILFADIWVSPTLHVDIGVVHTNNTSSSI